MKKLFLLAVILLSSALSGCGYNMIQQKDEAVSAAWSQVLNEYKRRADLVPSLVNTVKGYAAHEERTLTEVTQARAQVGSIQASPALVNDPQAFARFQEAQTGLTQALNHLMVVSEKYPTLQANQNFQELMAQLEGTENRIAVARRRYIESVQDYNVYIRRFPVNLTAMTFHYPRKANFTVDNPQAIQQAPSVDFNTATPAVPRAATR